MSLYKTSILSLKSNQIFLNSFLRIFSLAILTIFLFSKPAKAGIFSPYLDLYLTGEVSSSRFTADGSNSRFKDREDMGESAAKLNNLAIGTHIRFLDRFGVNANWTQNNLVSAAINGTASLNGTATFKSDQFNLTGLVFVPVVSRRVEFFGEGGITYLGSSLSYGENESGKNKFVLEKSKDTTGIYGGGLQISITGNDFVRFSVHRYTNKIGPLNSNYITYRVGYLFSF